MHSSYKYVHTHTHTHTQDTLRVIHGCVLDDVYVEINRQNLPIVYFKSILCNVLQYACNYFDNVQTGTTNATTRPGGFSWN